MVLVFFVAILLKSSTGSEFVRPRHPTAAASRRRGGVAEFGIHAVTAAMRDLITMRAVC